MTWTSRLLRIAASALAGVALISIAARAQPIEWHMNVNLQESRPEAKQTAAFAAMVNERSHGRLTIKVFYAGALGIASADELRSLRTGSLDANLTYAGYFGRDAPEVASAVVQGVILDPKENLAIVPVLEDIYTTYYHDKWNAETVGWVLGSVFDIAVFCKEPVNTMAQLRTKKLRVWAKDQVEAFQKLGVAAQIVDQNNLYLALQTGVVDCALYVGSIAKTISLQEVTKYSAYLHTYTLVPDAIVVSGKAWSALPDDLKKIVREAGEETAQTTLKLALDRTAEDAAMKDLSAQGLHILEPFPIADRKALFEASSAIWKDQVDKIGRDAPKFRERVVQALEASRAKAQ